MASDRRFQCVAVRSPRGATTTEIDWADGHKGTYPHDILRGYCPCAGCQGHTGTIKFIESSATQRDLEDLEVVGNYALRLQWFDGHGTGLYSYRYLRALCQCDVCRSVAAAGAPAAAPEGAAVDHPDLPRV
jgi:DUF971 family protein